MLRHYDSLFIVKGEGLGYVTSIGMHRIRTRDNIAVALPYRRTIPSQVMGVKEQIYKSVDGGVIVSSRIEYASPLVNEKRTMGI